MWKFSVLLCAKSTTSGTNRKTCPVVFYVHAGVAQFSDCSDRMENLGSVSGRYSY